jgi:nitrate reductase gamma subunit
VAYIKSLHQANRQLWRVSFLFHAGLYLLIAALVLLVANVAFHSFLPAAGNRWPGSGLWL